MPIVSAPKYEKIAREIATEMNWKHHQLEARRFPDDEGYVRIPEEVFDSIRSEPVILVSNTYPDNNIVETLLLLNALKDVRGGQIEDFRGIGEDLADVGLGLILAVPYFGYARQDKRFQRGEPVSAYSIARILAQHCDGIVVLDIHEEKVMQSLEVPVIGASAMPEIGQHLMAVASPDLILSPDKGAIGLASAVAEHIGCEFSYLEKRRIDAHTIEHTPKNLDVNGKVVAIVDDMISTGGTIRKATEALKRQGASAVHAACTHGLFTGGALTRLEKELDGIHSTDSLENPRSVVSSATGFTRALKGLLSLDDFKQ